MVQSLNTKVDLVIDATSFTWISDYGKIMIGDKGFEFYNSRDSNKYIQIFLFLCIGIFSILLKLISCYSKKTT